MVADYLDHVATLGLSGRAVRDRIRIARDFTARHRDLHAWMKARFRQLSGSPRYGTPGRGR
ncbi:hypothetical protein [Mycobacterium kubicae]|uniref:hypothetical protein n=1 Tax=Mycobacterium kubicae TaxID=120959 RepID=UPI00163EDE1E|nr:hypothetical protein [Mycobacterium kubicae]QNI11042.1 hypothetical protein GAN18_07305 [Mycobacterium kubicae]